MEATIKVDEKYRPALESLVNDVELADTAYVKASELLHKTKKALWAKIRKEYPETELRNCCFDKNKLEIIFKD